MKRITATEASRSFSRVLDQAEHGGECFIIERNGRPVAELRPAAKSSTVRDLNDFLRDVQLPDPDFRDDMLEIIERSSLDVGRDAWTDTDR
ncbi:MAG: type II toxin-antitoxin system Phd/YefM family antitoxin [Solirubrobacteraceae bacterium]